MVSEEQEKKWEIEKKFKKEKKDKVIEFIDFLMEEYDISSQDLAY